MDGKEIKPGQGFNPKEGAQANDALNKYRDSFLNSAGAHVPFAEFINRRIVSFRKDAVLKISMSLPIEEAQRFLETDPSDFQSLDELQIPSPIKDYLAKEYFDKAIIKINRIVLDAHRVLLDTYRLDANSEKKQQFILFNLRDKTSILFKEYKKGVPPEKQSSIDENIINNFTQMVANDKNVADILGEKGEVAVLMN